MWFGYKVCFVFMCGCYSCCSKHFIMMWFGYKVCFVLCVVVVRDRPDP